ncbi:MAG: HEPN domain-containing protein [Elusimicrobia bacterium]|nr:HEPN domain-containing protein [Elusimicrobiota bacterium]
MINKLELRKIARARLKDAEALFNSKRYDGAIYICGYAIELALKYRACRALRWPEYPSTKKDFEGLNSFKTHSLEMLLRLSGVEEKVKTKYASEWSFIKNWNPEMRYDPIGSTTKQQTRLLIESVKILVGILG